MVTRYQNRLEAAKRSSTLHLLFKCSRLLNERAINSLPPRLTRKQPTAAHLALFPHIDLERGTRPSELAAQVGISKQAISQLLDDLEEMDVIVRVSDAEDRRAKRVFFTKAGKQAMLDGLLHLKQVERSLRRELGDQTLSSLRSALLQLHDHLIEPQINSKRDEPSC